MTDPTRVVINAVSLMVLVFGLIEFLKNAFKLEGTSVTVLSFLVGVITMLVYLIGDYLPDPYGMFVKWLFAALTVGLAASGYYKFMNQRFPRVE